MSIYSDKLAYVQFIINSRDSIAQMCTREDTLAFNLGAPYIDDVMSNNTQKGDTWFQTMTILVNNIFNGPEWFYKYFYNFKGF